MRLLWLRKFLKSSQNSAFGNSRYQSNEIVGNLDEMDEEEDEIWGYKSIKRVKRNECQRAKPPSKDESSQTSTSSNKVNIVIKF